MIFFNKKKFIATQFKIASPNFLQTAAPRAVGVIVPPNDKRNLIIWRNTRIQVTTSLGGITIFLLFPFLLFCPVLPALLNHHAAIRPLCSPVKQHNVLFQLDKSNKNSLLYLFRICSHNLDL